MDKPELKDRVPQVKLVYDPSLPDDDILTTWTSSGRTGFIDPETPIVKRLGLGAMKLTIAALYKQIDKAVAWDKTAYCQWGKRKSGKGG